ncbi:MAG: GDYXXLXY domain-containing protein, partial [Armatimonadetes bacterium]|nr:GDYXXLXY domain-containing protein [Armatimonadota bacterium]
QLVFLVGESVYYQVRRETGAEIRLKVVPVDPRSLFMGNYMTLSYDVSRLSAWQCKSHGLDTSTLGRNQTVFVGLAQGMKFAKVVDIVLTIPPKHDPSIVYVRGRVTRNWSMMRGASGPSDIWVEYGIERYFIPEARQEEVNRMGRNNIVAIASVGPDGQAMLKGIEVNGKRLEY